MTEPKEDTRLLDCLLALGGLIVLLGLRAWCVLWHAEHDFLAADGTNSLPDCNRCGAHNPKAGYD